jgi:hypothetical protein
MPAQAEDVSASVIGTTQALINSRHAGVVAANLAQLSSSAPGRAAHAALTLRFETGGTWTAPELATAQIYDDFLTHPACNSAAVIAVAYGTQRCALFSTMIYEEKNRQSVFQWIAAAWTGYQTGLAISDMIVWTCANLIDCTQVPPMEPLPGDVEATLEDPNSPLSNWAQDITDGVPVPLATMGEWEEEIDSDGGFGISGGAMFVGAPYFYGPWGIVTEIEDIGGGDPCQVTGAANAVKPATCD